MLSLQRLSNPKGKKFSVIIRFWETAHLPFPQANMTNKGKMLAKGRGQSLVPRNAGNIHWKDSREPKVPFFFPRLTFFFVVDDTVVFVPWLKKSIQKNILFFMN